MIYCLEIADRETKSKLRLQSNRIIHIAGHCRTKLASNLLTNKFDEALRMGTPVEVTLT